jgi:hypothetical protein
MEQQDPNNNDSNWNVIIRQKTAPIVKTKEQLLQELLKNRRAIAYARKKAWEAKQEAIRQGKIQKEKIEKASLKNMSAYVKENENSVIIQDHANHQVLFLLKRGQEIPIEDFKVVDRADYLVGNKADWNHNFNPLVKQYLKYGELNTVDIDGCHQYVIVGAIADNDDKYFDYGEFEYGVKDDAEGKKICYHHCFRTNDCKYLKQQDKKELKEYYLQERNELQQEKQDNSDNSEKE